MPKISLKGLKPRHLSSNEPLVFFMQALIVVTVIFILAYLIFSYTWKVQRHLAQTQNSIPVQNGQIDVSTIKKGIDESQFLTQPGSSVDQSKIQTLFPEIKP